MSEDIIQVYVPPGWPSVVHPPGAESWQQSAVAYLLDHCPSEFRGYPVMRRHPVVLARCAKDYVRSQLQATRHTVSSLRLDLAPYVSSDVSSQAISALHREEARLLRVLRAVDLVGQALRDVRFRRKL